MVKPSITQTIPYDSQEDSSLLMPKISAKFQRGHPQQRYQLEVG